MYYDHRRHRCRRRPDSLESHALTREFLVNGADVQALERLVALQGDGGGDTRTLAADRTAHHVARRSVRYVVAADASPGNQQIADALGYERAIGDVPVPPGGRQDQNAVAVDELGEDADRIIEPCLFTHVVSGQVVQSIDLARVANAERHAEIAQLCVLAARHELTQR